MRKIIIRIQELTGRYKLLIHNFSYLSSLQVFTILVQLIALPYLLSVLGKELYGLVIFAQTVISYFQILINFGFNYSATINISVHRDNKEKLSEIVSSTLTIKAILFILSFIILYALLNFIPRAEEYKVLFYLMMYLCFYEWIFPIWFFQGIEKMKYITIINLSSRIFFLAMIFIFIKNENDYLLVPIINGIGYSLAGFFSLWIVFKKEKIKYKLPDGLQLKYYIKDTIPLFFGNIAGKIKILSNKAILGAFVGMESVAIYDIADKIKEVFIIFLQIIGQVLFPNVSKNKNNELVRKGIRLTFFLGLTVYLVTGILLNYIIPRYFEPYGEVVAIYWLLGLLIFIQPVSFLIGTGVLLVNNLKKNYTINLYISSGIYLLGIITFFSIDMLNVITVSISLIISAITGLLSNIIVGVRNNKRNWII